MLLQKMLPNFSPETTHNPLLSKARKRHNSLPKTQYNKFSHLAKHDYRQALNITRNRYEKLAQTLRALIREHYISAEQNKINQIVIFLIDILSTKAKIFPDMDYENVWYCDHYDLIELARNMGVGDETLPHWQQEKNLYNRYLEISTSDLAKILLEISEEALIEGCQSGADVNKWFSYVARETLKSRKRRSRYRQKQSETLYISCGSFGREG
jgi:hypothetical protein